MPLGSRTLIYYDPEIESQRSPTHPPSEDTHPPLLYPRPRTAHTPTAMSSLSPNETHGHKASTSEPSPAQLHKGYRFYNCFTGLPGTASRGHHTSCRRPPWSAQMLPPQTISRVWRKDKITGLEHGLRGHEGNFPMALEAWPRSKATILIPRYTAAFCLGHTDFNTGCIGHAVDPLHRLIPLYLEEQAMEGVKIEYLLFLVEYSCRLHNGRAEAMLSDSYKQQP